MEWITVKTRNHIGQVLIDPTLPIADQISDQAIWWGRNLPDEAVKVDNGPVIFWLIIYALVIATVWIGGL